MASASRLLFVAGKEQWFDVAERRLKDLVGENPLWRRVDDLDGNDVLPPGLIDFMCYIQHPQVELIGVFNVGQSHRIPNARRAILGGPPYFRAEARNEEIGGPGSCPVLATVKLNSLCSPIGCELIYNLGHSQPQRFSRTPQPHLEQVFHGRHGPHVHSMTGLLLKQHYRTKSQHFSPYRMKALCSRQRFVHRALPDLPCYFTALSDDGRKSLHCCHPTRFFPERRK